MECPICGNHCEELEFTSYTVEMTPDKVADYVFKKLIEKGYAPNYDDISVILEIIDDYVINEGVFGDNAESPE